MSEMTERPCRACSGTGYRGLDDCSDCGCTGTITVVPARPLADPTETPEAVREFLDELGAGLAKLPPDERARVLSDGGALLEERRRVLSDPTETLAPEDGYTTPERAYETLALIEEHRLRVTPALDGGWIVDWSMQPYLDARGPTIADAVRACVSRIRGQQ